MITSADEINVYLAWFVFLVALLAWAITYTWPEDEGRFHDGRFKE